MSRESTLSEELAVLEFERPIVELEKRIAELRDVSVGQNGSGKRTNFSPQIADLEKQAIALRQEIYSRLTAHQKVQLSRHPRRPYFFDWVDLLFEDFLELHGDRAFRDDPAVVGGIATFQGREVVLLGHQKGRNTKENMYRNFGMARPEGYRKSTRLLRLGHRFNRPVICFIDTPGAYPGIGAEERGQAEAIAKSLQVMASLRTPIISVVIGEGGSGGALALGVANRILMLEYSVYSVISPEGCASILWRDPTRVSDAAEQLKVTASDLRRLGIADEVVQEAPGGAHRGREETAKNLKECIARHLSELVAMSPEELVDDRYKKFRDIGEFVSG